MRFWIGLVLCGAAFAGDLSLNVAGLRIMPERWNKTANLAKFEQYSRSAAAQGAQPTLAPEGFLEGYIANIQAKPDLTPEKYITISGSMDGPLLKTAPSLAPYV